MSLRKNNTWVRRFHVSDPRRHKKGFTVYKVISIVFPKESPEAVTNIVVWKRYNDFKKLHRELEIKHKQLHLQDTFPAFAKSKMFGRFDHEVIEERRKCALILLEFIGEHSLLFTSNVFVQFFEKSYSVEDPTDTLPGNPSQTNIHSPMGLPSGNLLHVTSTSTSIPVEMSNSCTSTNNNTDVNKPLLGGTWQFPQVPESISLSSESSDDRTTFTDTDSSAISGVSSPLQNVDLQFFDPLQQSPSHQPDSTVQKTVECNEPSNSWLLSLPCTSSDSLNEKHSQNSNLKQEVAQNLTVNPSLKPPSSIPEKKNVIGHTEHPAASFFSVRTEDFEASNLSNIQLMSKSNGFNGIFTSSSTDLHLAGHTSIQGLPSVNYIFEAAYHTSQAKLNEANGEFEAAFAFYKAGIACLLSGVQDETDIKRKVVVSEKISKYLLHAEMLYNKYIGTRSTDRMCPLRQQLRRPLSELRCYRVLGVVDSLMLVMNKVEDCCYVMKVLHKSSCPVGHQSRTITPQNVPYMVTMHCYFETESAVFLVLQHVSGGKLWQHISSYFQSLPQTPVHAFKKGNTYHGKTCLVTDPNKASTVTFHGESPKILRSKKIICDIKVEEFDSVSSHEQSYLDLIQEYTSGAKINSTESEQNVSPSMLSGTDLCDDNVGTSVDHREIVISNENISMNRHDVDAENSNRAINLPLTEIRQSDDDNQAFGSVANNNRKPDLLSHSPSLSYSWSTLDTLPTQDLVKNAQRLLESVSETLMHSDIVVSRLEGDDRLSVEYHTSKVDNVPSDKQEDKELESTTVDVVNCPLVLDTSESHNQQITRQKSSPRKRSIHKRNSVKSLERRISTDDLLGGGAHALSGSLDREWGCGPPRPRLPEGPIRWWAAQLLVCLDSLHRWGVMCRDLHPDNLLLGEKGQLLVTYMCQWERVDALPNSKAVRKLYAAPEVSGILPITQAADWWSFGAILYELVTGRSLTVSHPGGIHSHTIIDIPDHVSENAKSLLQELLRYNAVERLGAGVNGTEELKSHPFFSGVEWQTVLDEGTSV